MNLQNSENPINPGSSIEPKSSREPKNISAVAATLPDINAFSGRQGLVRHGLVVGSCLALAGGILALSMIDLRSLIKTDVVIDSNLTVHYFAKPNQLPPNMSFKGDNSNIGGHYIERTSFQEGPEISEGLIPVVESNWGTYKEGYVDASGKVVIPPKFNVVGEFHDGLALAQPVDSGKWGYIDRTGQFAIQPQFNRAYDFHKTVANVSIGSDNVLIDRNGKTITTGAIKDLGLGCLIKKKDKYGLVNASGASILPPEYDQISTFVKGLDAYPSFSWNQGRAAIFSEASNTFPYLKVSKHGKWGVVDSSGKFVLEPKYSGIVSFNKGHAGVVINGKVGFVDLSGNIVIEPIYDFATAYDDLIAVRTGKKWHLIKPTGEIVSKGGIDGVICNRSGDWFSDGLAPVIEKDLVGFMDKNGNMAIPAKFQYALGFDNGHAAVWDGTYWRFIDRSGNYVPDLKIGTLRGFTNGWARATMAGPFYSFGNTRAILSEATRLKSTIMFFKRATIQWITDWDSHANDTNY